MFVCVCIARDSMLMWAIYINFRGFANYAKQLFSTPFSGCVPNP